MLGKQTTKKQNAETHVLVVLYDCICDLLHNFIHDFIRAFIGLFLKD